MDTLMHVVDVERTWVQPSNAERERWDRLSAHLLARAEEICLDNECTEEEHFCDSSAYVTEGGDLIDVCLSDYFQGWGSADEEARGQYAVVSLGSAGSGAALYADVMAELPWE